MSKGGAGGPLELCEAVITRTDEAGVRVRALGGLGIHLRVPERPAPLRREYGDADLVGRSADRTTIERELEQFGLLPEQEFNTLNGRRRQIWWSADQSTHLDLFLGEFAMCHSLDLDDRLPVDHWALPAADLLLTKLQVVELNGKDVRDAATLLISHELGGDDGEGTINVGRLRDVLSRDWGFFTTVSDNLERLPGLVAELSPDHGDRVAAVAAEIVRELDDAPKGRRFQLRAKVGRRKRWYELPDETLTT